MTFDINNAIGDLKGIQLPPSVALMLSVLAERVPNRLVVKNRVLDPRELLKRVIADGDLDAEDAAAVALAWATAPKAPPKPTDPGGGGSEHEDAPGARVALAKIVARVSAFERPALGREPIPIAFEGSDPEQIVIARQSGGDPQTAFDNGTTLAVEIDALDAQGNGLRIDLDPERTPSGQTNHPELLGRFRFEAWTPNRTTLLGAIGGAGLRDAAHFNADGDPVNWLDPEVSDRKGPGAWRRSGGVWAEVRVRTQCLLRVVYDFEGVRIVSNAFLTPEVR